MAAPTAGNAATSSDLSGTDALTLTLPAGLSDGDVVVVSFGLNDGDGTPPTATIDSASFTNSWAQRITGLISAQSAVRGYVWTIVWKTGDPTTVDITPSASATKYGCSFAMSGAAEDPHKVSIFNTETSSAPTALSVTTTIDDCLVLHMQWNDDGADQAADPYPTADTHGALIFVDEGGDLGNGGGVCFSYIVKGTAGATGNVDFSMDASDENAAFTIAFAPSGISITNAEDEIFVDQEQTIVVSGTVFEAAQGTGKIEIGDNATYGSATLVSLQVNSWSDTSIDCDMEEAGTGNPIADDLTLGSLWLFVTNDTAEVSAGRPVTVNAAGASWGHNVNTNWSQAVDVNFRVRFLIQEGAGAAYLNQTFQLQYNLAAGGWNDVNAASSVVRSAASTHVADAEDTAQILGAGTFVTPNDGFDEVNGEVGGADLDGAGSDEVELEFCVQIRSGDVANGQEIQLRIDEGDGTDLGTYTNTPTITVVEGGGGGPAVLPGAVIAGVA